MNEHPHRICYGLMVKVNISNGLGQNSVAKVEFQIFYLKFLKLFKEQCNALHRELFLKGPQKCNKKVAQKHQL